MLTCCPHCQTCFRVTAEQLKPRQGQVRCGECREVFNALDSLADEALIVVPVPVSPMTPVETAETETRRSPDGGEEAVADTLAMTETAETIETIETAASGLTEPEPEPEPEPEVAPAPEPEVEPNQVPEVPESEPEPESEVAPEPAPEQAVEPVVEEWTPVPAPPPPPRRWPWTIGVLILSLLTLGQLSYLFRTELAVLVPELRPTLAAACDLLGCTLPRPRKPEMVGIETSDLAPEGRGLLLTATLKNRAPFAQDYPHLELTLTDTQDEALVRKVLAPADYLPAGQPVADGFAARGEVAVRLAFDAAGVPAVGYRLYLFYP